MIISFAIFAIIIQLFIILIMLFDKDFRTKKDFFFWFGCSFIPLLPVIILAKREIEKLK